MWDIRDVAQIDALADGLVGDRLTLPDVADRLGLPPGRVRQLFRDRKLIAVQRPDGTPCVPAAFIDGKQIVKGLHGTLTLLFDCGFDEAESLLPFGSAGVLEVRVATLTTGLVPFTVTVI